MDKLVALQLEDVREVMAAQYAAKATALSTRIANLEQQLQQQAAQAAAAAAVPPASASSHGGKSSSKGSSRVASAKPVAG